MFEEMHKLQLESLQSLHKQNTLMEWQNFNI